MKGVPEVLVSICIPTFNGRKFIHRALESAINQSYDNIEVIVTDDVSSDGTEEVVKLYAAKDKRIKYFRNKENIGGIRNFFKAVELASGQYVQCVCHDDWISKSYVEEGVKNFLLYPGTAAVLNSVIHFSLDDGGNFCPTLGHQQNFFVSKTKKYSVDTLLRKGYKSQLVFVSGFGTMHRRQDLIDIAPFMDEIQKNSYYSSAREAGFWGGELIPLKIFARYKYFISTKNTAYIKVEHLENYGEDRSSRDVSERAMRGYAIRKFYGEIYTKELRKHFSSFRIGFAVREMADIVVSLMKKKLDFQSYRDVFSAMSLMLEGCSLYEKTLALFLAPFSLVSRFFDYFHRGIKRMTEKKEKFVVYYPEAYLRENNDMTGRFIFENTEKK